MDFIEHDLKTLLSMQKMPFLASETKTLLRQLLSALSLLHQNWIIHRDLKTSNLLMNNRGQIKLADFGLARMYGEPRSNDMTKLVVTLWYRAPELLLGADTYDVAIDMWSVGCIFAELITKEPLFPGKNEADQITKVRRGLGPTLSVLLSDRSHFVQHVFLDLSAAWPANRGLMARIRYAASRQEPAETGCAAFQCHPTEVPPQHGQVPGPLAASADIRSGTADHSGRGTQTPLLQRVAAARPPGYVRHLSLCCCW